MAKITNPEDAYIVLESIFDNYEGYDRRLKAYEYLYKILHPENFNEGIVNERTKLFCAHCGSRLMHEVYTDVNSPLVCKYPLCTK